MSDKAFLNYLKFMIIVFQAVKWFTAFFSGVSMAIALSDPSRLPVLAFIPAFAWGYYALSAKAIGPLKVEIERGLAQS